MLWNTCPQSKAKIFIIIYYLTNSIATSQRLYYEQISYEEFGKELDRVPITAPSGCAKLRYELVHIIDWVLKENFVNLVHVAQYPDGVHFAATPFPTMLYTAFIPVFQNANIKS